MSKSETLRQVGQQLKDEATQALKSAAHGGEQPPQWVQAFMSPTEWEHYHQLRNEASRANTEPASPTGGSWFFSQRYRSCWQDAHRPGAAPARKFGASRAC